MVCETINVGQPSQKYNYHLVCVSWRRMAYIKKKKKTVIQSSYSAAQNYMDKRDGEQGSLPGMAKCPLLCAWWFCKSDTVSHSATVLWAHFVCTGYGYLGKTSTHLVWLQRDQWYRKRWADSDSLKFWTSAVTLTINTEVRSFGKTKIWNRMTASVFVFGFWQDTLAYDGVRTTKTLWPMMVYVPPHWDWLSDCKRFLVQTVYSWNNHILIRYKSSLWPWFWRKQTHLFEWHCTDVNPFWE